MRATDIHTREEDGGPPPLIHRLTRSRILHACTAVDARDTNGLAAASVVVAFRRLGLCSAVDRQREVDQYRRPHARPA
jgi:hypothetical protein